MFSNPQGGQFRPLAQEIAAIVHALREEGVSEEGSEAFASQIIAFQMEQQLHQLDAQSSEKANMDLMELITELQETLMLMTSPKRKWWQTGHRKGDDE